MQPCLELRDIVVEYVGKRVLRVPFLQVYRGEVLTLIGPNGSGKSTLVRVMGLLEKPLHGEVYFGKQRMAHRSDLLSLRRRIATVFQESLLCNATVEENVALGMKLRGVDRTERKKRTGRWMELLGISHLARRKARTLSGGEAQRTSLARAFVLDPEILLLDEPLASLDPPTRDSLLADLRAILREARTTTVFVTHDRDEALSLSSRVGVMLTGEIRQLGPPEEVFSSPATEEVARFVGVETLLPGKIIEQKEGLATVVVKGINIRVASERGPGEEVLACLRPEDVTLSWVEDPPFHSSARNQLLGSVTRLTPLGFLVRVSLNCGFPLQALVTKHACAELGLQEGKKVVASFKATAVHLI